MPVLDGDTAATLQARVLAREHEFLVETLNMIITGSIRLTWVQLQSPFHSSCDGFVGFYSWLEPSWEGFWEVGIRLRASHGQA